MAVQLLTRGELRERERVLGLGAGRVEHVGALERRQRAAGVVIVEVEAAERQPALGVFGLQPDRLDEFGSCRGVVARALIERREDEQRLERERIRAGRVTRVGEG